MIERPLTEDTVMLFTLRSVTRNNHITSCNWCNAFSNRFHNRCSFMTEYAVTKQKIRMSLTLLLSYKKRYEYMKCWVKWVLMYSGLPNLYRYKFTVQSDLKFCELGKTNSFNAFQFQVENQTMFEKFGLWIFVSIWQHWF